MRCASIVHDVVQFMSIFSGSLRLLSTGSTGRKNTVCFLLKIWPPGINPELMMECKLLCHTRHDKCAWRIRPESWTLSFSEGPMRLRLERPSKARRYNNSPEELLQHWSTFLLLLSCFSSTCRQTNDDNTRNNSKDDLFFSRIQLSPSFFSR